MRYIFLSLDPLYGYRDKPPTRNNPLYDLYNRLDDDQMRWIEIEEDEKNPKNLIIWSRKNIKEGLMPNDFNVHQDFTRLKDYLVYSKQFCKYSRKRFKEMPAIRISRENYEQLKQQFAGVYQRQPQYLIMREHDDGRVDMLEKNELSQEDIANMNREHKIFQNYIKRLEAYRKAYSNRSHIWHSLEDNEFESDFALYDPVDEQDVD